MGFWARALPWPYGIGTERRLSYLSFLHLSVGIDGQVFHSLEDFAWRGIDLVSRYHTKHLLSYDWSFEGLQISAKYSLVSEHALFCSLEITNTSPQQKACVVHATNIYGFPARRYWGCDGISTIYKPFEDAAFAKVWAYGDIFALGANRASSAHKATASDEEWTQWITTGDLGSNEGALVRFSPGVFHNGFSAGLTPVHEEQLEDHVNMVMSYEVNIAPGRTEVLRLCLSRGVNEVNASATLRHALSEGPLRAAEQLSADEDFYRRAPRLEEDWPEDWKHGWIYDLETIRMTIRPPVGIFRHPWDGMQVHTPRSVLGEMSLDTLCLSYADIDLAKKVIFGTFADAPMPNVPCTREDGSMNMISENASECGTAPNWGFGFLVIQSILARDGDLVWLRDLYPYLERFLQWWMENRADDHGWFHADCSWESGQDGSQRFRLSGDTPGASTVDVRTVDIEASMAHAFRAMAEFALRLEREADVRRWNELAEDRARRVRSMYVDGWYRDFDASTGDPILIRITSTL
ncbi:MAG: hypothetical protein IPK19_11150 [Chloroflexi bacterium]|nr:hypothetical protein [Chloroflexota bacterium]